MAEDMVYVVETDGGVYATFDGGLTFIPVVSVTVAEDEAETYNKYVEDCGGF
jgi:hypothetical protein